MSIISATCCSKAHCTLWLLFLFCSGFFSVVIFLLPATILSQQKAVTKNISIANDPRQSAYTDGRLFSLRVSETSVYGPLALLLWGLCGKRTLMSESTHWNKAHTSQWSGNHREKKTKMLGPVTLYKGIPQWLEGPPESPTPSSLYPFSTAAS